LKSEDLELKMRGELGLEAMIEKNHDDLREILNLFQPAENYSDFRIGLTKDIDDGLMTDDVLSDLWAGYAMRPSSSSFRTPLVYSCLYCLLSEIALRQGNREKAWSCISEARFYCGKLGSMNPNEENAYKAQAERHRQFAAKGGNAARDKREPARVEVRRLLGEKCPPGGWKTEPAAIKGILKDISAFVADKKISLTEDGLPSTILSWILKNEETAAVYKSNSFAVKSLPS